ncbi:MAG: hypothetical protein E6Q88_12715 [Lysobacteraceae bacterium]|nr:MAG: hypothetical protein E6Q88_12715 [Xanthomonadaceae bacterium]
MSSQSRSPSYEAGRRDASAQAQRVQLSTEMGCIDTSTQLQLSESVKASIGDLGSLINDPRYRPLQVIWRTPVARYPAELLRAGAPGAVGLLLYINTEGRVARTEVVCATDPAFVALAEQVVRRNRYSPSTFDGKPIQDVAYQVIAYGVEAD